MLRRGGWGVAHLCFSGASRGGIRPPESCPSSVDHHDIARHFISKLRRQARETILSLTAYHLSRAQELTRRSLRSSHAASVRSKSQTPRTLRTLLSAGPHAKLQTGQISSFRHAPAAAVVCCAALGASTFRVGHAFTQHAFLVIFFFFFSLGGFPDGLIMVWRYCRLPGR